MSLNIIDATIEFLEKSNNIIIDVDYDKTGVIIEEFQENCLLLHNLLSMKEQIQLCKLLQKQEELSPIKQSSERILIRVYDDMILNNNTLKFRKNFKDSIYDKMLNKAINVINRNYKLKKK
eukprot:542303_1